jgi:predicted dehydrogenase
MPRSVHRRRFLKETAAATTFYLSLPYARGDVKKSSPNERLNLGVIGVAGRGADNLKGIVSENIVAICDVDENRVGDARKAHPSATYTQDYRKLLDQKNIDAVVISTPDHMHAIPTLAALRSGRHAYCEKPLAHTVREVRLVRETAAKSGLVTQMGTQIHAGDNYRRVVELVQAGTIGPIRRVHCWVGVKPAAGQFAKTELAPPAGLNYDLWLGPAPYRPYDKSHLHFVWRWWWDFGGGVLADLACHHVDLPTWALGLTAPTKITAKGEVKHEGDNPVPDVMQVDYQYPARGDKPPVHLTWYHGVDGPDLSGGRVFKGYRAGTVFEGEKGQIVADYSKHKLLPEDKWEGFTPPKPTIAKSLGHHEEWINAIKTKGPTTCNFNYSGALAEAVLLGNVAYRSGAEVEWDAAHARIPNSASAAAFLDKEYRKGWSLQG